MSDFKLDDYVEVPERIRQFFEKYPDGSLQPAEDFPRFQAHGDRTMIVYKALAFRTPDDPRPGVGMAAEPFPGTTPYTKDSELMNAETSAWGRALVALGFVSKKVASRQEVQARQGNGAPPERAGGNKITPKQIEGFVMRRAKQAGLSREDVDRVARAKFGVAKLEDLPRKDVELLVEALGNPVPVGGTDVPEPPVEVPDADPADPSELPW